MSNNRDFAMSRRSLLAGLAGVGGLAALTACGSPGSGPASPARSGGKQAVITHWDKWASQEPWVKKEIGLFQEANPGVTIQRTMQASGNLENLLDLAARGGDMPDVFMVAQDRLDEHIAQGRVLDLSKYATLEWQKTFPAHSFVEGVNAAGGKIYSAPFEGYATDVQLYLNNQVFKDAGLVEADGTVKIPKNWNDVTLFAEQITKKGNGSVHGLGFGNSAFPIIPWWVNFFVNGSGTPATLPSSTPGGLDPRTGKFTLRTESPYLDFLALFLEWRDKGYIFPQSLSIDDEISRQHFARGKFGMIVGGVWNQPGWTDLGFTDYTTVTMVPQDGRRKSFFYRGAGSVHLAVSATTKHPDEAWEWFKWWYGQQAGTRFVQELKGGVSIHPEANDPSKIDFAPFAQFVAGAELVLPGPQPSLRNPATIHVVPKPVTPSFEDICTGLYTGQIKDMRAALTKLNEDLEKEFVKALDKAVQEGHKVSRDDYVFADWDLGKPYKWDIPEYLGA
ncbi:substrate-binding domain-containing protein [Nonomuraea sp. NPDC050310]|uniref:ABC transporter substrate-binding protein n=1 Tax=Nonomuraea sp. NPDC050310 TaxID=3154935 RepID=UPI0033E5CF10